jgi:hypothetical protein
MVVTLLVGAPQQERAWGVKTIAAAKLAAT